MYKFFRDKFREEDGAAIVEFSILTTIMIPLMLYIIFFSELIHFRLKIQELKFFVGWEMAAYNLSNYSSAPNSTSQSNFDKMTIDIENSARKLYANWDSADPVRSTGFIMITPSNTIDIGIDSKDLVESSRMPNEKVGDGVSLGGQFSEVITQIDSFLQQGIDFILGDQFGFNTKHIGTKSWVRAGYSITDRMATSDVGTFTNKEMLYDDLASGDKTPITTTTFHVLHDTWALSEGKTVVNTDASNKCLGGDYKPNGDCGSAYRRQVQYMSLLGTGNFFSVFIRGVFNVIGSGALAEIDRIPFVGGIFAALEDPAEARMASVNYYFNSPGILNVTDKSGNPLKGQSKFQTTPFVHIFTRENQGNSEASEGIREYKNTLLKRRNFYMGNNLPYCSSQDENGDCTTN